MGLFYKENPHKFQGPMQPHCTPMPIAASESTAGTKMRPTKRSSIYIFYFLCS